MDHSSALDSGRTVLQVGKNTNSKNNSVPLEVGEMRVIMQHSNQCQGLQLNRTSWKLGSNTKFDAVQGCWKNLTAIWVYIG